MGEPMGKGGEDYAHQVAAVGSAADRPPIGDIGDEEVLAARFDGRVRLEGELFPARYHGTIRSGQGA